MCTGGAAKSGGKGSGKERGREGRRRTGECEDGGYETKAQVKEGNEKGSREEGGEGSAESKKKGEAGER